MVTFGGCPVPGAPPRRTRLQMLRDSVGMAVAQTQLPFGSYETNICLSVWPSVESRSDGISKEMSYCMCLFLPRVLYQDRP